MRRRQQPQQMPLERVSSSSSAAAAQQMHITTKAASTAAMIPKVTRFHSQEQSPHPKRHAAILPKTSVDGCRENHSSTVSEVDCRTRLLLMCSRPDIHRQAQDCNTGTNLERHRLPEACNSQILIHIRLGRKIFLRVEHGMGGYLAFPPPVAL